MGCRWIKFEGPADSGIVPTCNVFETIFVRIVSAKDWLPALIMAVERNTNFELLQIPADSNGGNVHGFTPPTLGRAANVLEPFGKQAARFAVSVDAGDRANYPGIIELLIFVSNGFDPRGGA